MIGLCHLCFPCKVGLEPSHQGLLEVDHPLARAFSVEHNWCLSILCLYEAKSSPQLFLVEIYHLVPIIDD
jgi:hypothetical protein